MKSSNQTEKPENSDDEMSDENESEDVSEKRITLLAILEAFNAPIKFDQAWAIIYIVSEVIFLKKFKSNGYIYFQFSIYRSLKTMHHFLLSHPFPKYF